MDYSQYETFDFDSAEAGTFFHAALDRFMKTAGGEKEWPRLPDERVDGIMDSICAELTQEWEGGPLREDPLGIWQGEETLRRVHHAARVLTRFASLEMDLEPYVKWIPQFIVNEVGYAVVRRVLEGGLKYAAGLWS